jgi:hypothetical protein
MAIASIGGNRLDEVEAGAMPVDAAERQSCLKINDHTLILDARSAPLMSLGLPTKTYCGQQNLTGVRLVFKK